jgi:hypothetical protein
MSDLSKMFRSCLASDRQRIARRIRYVLNAIYNGLKPVGYKWLKTVLLINKTTALFFRRMLHSAFHSPSILSAAGALC